MKFLALICDHCSAPLEVIKGQELVTCEYCHSRLKVQAQRDKAHTEVVESGEKNLSSSDLDTIKWQNELERLDREWMMKRESFMMKGKDGHMFLPDGGTQLGLSAVILFGIFWTGLTLFAFPPFALFGVCFIGFAIYQMKQASEKASDYEHAHRRYKSERSRLLGKINAAQPAESL